MTGTARFDQSFDEYLRSAGLWGPALDEQLAALDEGRAESLLSLLRRTGMVPEELLTQALRDYTGWPLVAGDELFALAPRVREAVEVIGLNLGWCRQHTVAVWLDGGRIACAVADLPHAGVNDLLRVKNPDGATAPSMHLARLADLEGLLSQAEGDPAATPAVHTAGLAHLRELAEEGPIVELVNSLLSQAVTRRASDIHVEPGERQFDVRVRVDGVMRALQRLPLERFDALVCRIKILSQLDIAERRLPQDGRMTARIHGETFDIRISVLPGVRGESVVMRLLRQDRQSFALSDLGMQADHCALFTRWVKEPNGIILVTGPTGSGKTTTLYTALDLGNDGLNKIITIEDPVEYKLHGITQLQVNSDIDYTFAAALRSILRHDPDIILIGEIRDPETAAIAVQSALTGHLVFSTLHTNSGAGAVGRLVDMGIEKFLLASSLRGVMAQRLIRRLCPHCSEPVGLRAAPQGALVEAVVGSLRALCPDVDVGEPALRIARGCDACQHTGYLGRIAVYELFEMSDEIRQQVLHGSEAALVALLEARGVRSMRQDGLLKAWSGITTVNEALSVG